MKYDYNVYFRQNCAVPMVLLLFVVFLFILNIHSLVEDGVPNTPKDVFHACCFMCIFLFLMIVNIIPLARGGAYLLIEKENDAIYMSGTIEDTLEIGFLGGQKYPVDRNHGYGEAIVVNGERYYLTTYGDFQIGDRVAFAVLPRSGFVLEMEQIA